jgi:hypothetical protein
MRREMIPMIAWREPRRESRTFWTLLKLKGFPISVERGVMAAA